jgi:hypothetical protein
MPTLARCDPPFLVHGSKWAALPGRLLRLGDLIDSAFSIKTLSAVGNVDWEHCDGMLHLVVVLSMLG